MISYTLIEHRYRYPLRHMLSMMHHHIVEPLQLVAEQVEIGVEGIH